MKKHLDQHEKIHVIQVFSCNYCKQTFSKENSMMKHKMKKHEHKKVDFSAGFGIFETKCEKTIPITIFKVQKETTKIQCGKCDYKTIKAANLKRHVLRKHRQPCISTSTKYRRAAKVLKNIEANEDLNKYIRLRVTDKVTKMTEADMSKLMANQTIANRQLIEILRFFRNKFGRSMFTPNLRKAMSARVNMLDDYFVTEDTTFQDKAGEKVTRPLTIPVDTNVFIEEVCAKRNLDPKDCTLVLGSDSGQGKLILTMIIKPKQQTITKSKYKASGSKRVLILATVEDVPENNFNMEVIFRTLNLNDLQQEYTIVCDLKLMAILLGISSCTSMHSCPYGECCKRDQCGRKTNRKGD
jgi:hypothetical protein